VFAVFNLAEFISCSVAAFEWKHIIYWQYSSITKKHRSFLAIPNSGCQAAADCARNVAVSGMKAGVVGRIFTKIFEVSTQFPRLLSKSTFVATVLAFLLIREWWEKVPSWIRRGFTSLL
jgi:hypothetical protein